MSFNNKILNIFQKVQHLFIYLFKTNLNEKNYLKNKFLDYEKIVVFDIGSNLGNFSNQIRKYKIANNYFFHLFEPNKDLVEVLKNKMYDCKINEVAISDQNTNGTLYLNSISSQSSLLKDSSFLGKNIKELNVKTIRLDSYIENESIDIIHLLKIDVEGHEFVSLKSLGKYLNINMVKVIKVEISFKDENNFTLINTLLNENGYYLDGFTNTKYINEKILFFDAYYSAKTSG